jgi:CRISPR/Cas system-associated exonuclease Cas4 (RecB family)
VSSTREYERCPRRYRFAYVERIPADRGLAPEGWRFGTVVHRGLEVGYRRHQAVGDSPSLAHAIPAALQAVDDALARERMPDGANRERAADVVRRSLATTQIDPDDILGVEHYFRAEATDGFRVAGTADLVVRTGPHSLEIRDHKVTRQLKTPAQLVADFQLNVYGWLAQREWPWAEQITIAHHYPLGGELVRVDLDPAQADAAITHVRNVAARAKADTEFAPIPGENCTSCVWARHCPAAPATAA